MESSKKNKFMKIPQTIFKKQSKGQSKLLIDGAT